jgi:GNAT superfamily N-acetyltransferase
MKISVRKGTKEDMPAVHALILELAVFEKAPEEVKTSAESMVADGFGDRPAFECLVAEVEGRVVGAAVYFSKYSTWKGRGIYLDDIVVTESMRGSGIGTRLFNALIAEARREGARQLHWQVLDWNAPAIRFYEKYKAHFDAEWINCKIDPREVMFDTLVI